MKFFTSIRLVLLGVWLGAACFFIAVAISAFSVLPAREMAGLVVNRTLAILNFSGLAIGVLLIITSLVGTKTVGKFWVWIERFLLLILAGACAVGQFVISQWLLLVRLEMGKPIDEVAVEDPLRIQFNQLHQYSEWVLMAAMIAALVAFLIISNRTFGAGKEKAADPLKDEFKI
jgi:hypothetical protein